MKKFVFFLLLAPYFLIGQDVQLKTIAGTVTDNASPMPNVTITTSETGHSALSDENGKYTINAKVGESISYSYTGMETVTIFIEDVTRILNITLYPKIEQLDEVVVTKSNRKSQEDLEKEYATNKNLIKTAYGILDADRAPGRIMLRNEEDLMPAAICILDLVRNEFPGVTVNGDCRFGGSIIIRGVGSISFNASAIFDIDGQIFTQTPLWLDINNIKRLAILNNYATATKYGGLASGGVVVVNTVSGTTYPNQVVDQARLKNNFYDNKAIDQKQILKNAPDYLKELYTAATKGEAIASFQKHRDKYNSSFSFFVDSYLYFNERWADTDFADTLIEENYATFENHPVALKSLAYAYDAQGDFKKSNVLYKEIFILRPHYAQSYFDLASSYKNIGEYQKAVTLYTRYDHLKKTGFMRDEVMELSTIMDRELNNVLAIKGNDLLSKRNLKKVAMQDGFTGTRLVFEWADSEAEFELQFVNPGNQYYKWNHSLRDNAERISDEKQIGYAVQEYLIDESLPGTWRVNCTYLGNKSLTPTYLKATIYHNYGTSGQHMDIKVFKLNLRNVNQQLFTISNSNLIVAK